MAETLQDRLASAVRARRGTLRLSQRDVAELAGVSERFVRFVEQGKPSVQLDLLLALLDTLGLELQVATRTSPAARALAGGPAAVGLAGAEMPGSKSGPADPQP